MTIFRGISFKEKADLLSFEYLRCIRYVGDSDLSQEFLAKKLYAKLISSSQLLEDFLDFHGAKNNRTWIFYRELTAAMRHLSLAGYSQKHILNRLKFYDLGDIRAFTRESEDTLQMIQDSIKFSAPVILDEAERLSIKVPETGYNRKFFPQITTNEQLEHNIDDQENKSQQRQKITSIASSFLELVDDFEEFSFYERYNIVKIRQLVPEKINEVEIRRFEMLLHNLQSSFDSYVIHGGLKFGNKKLKQLRSYFSITFHLLQAMGRLLHFYERHLHGMEYKDQYKSVSKSLSELIDPDILLDRAVNYGLFYAGQFLSSGKEIAHEILNENIERSSIIVGIPQERGFHSRPSLLVAKIVHHYGGEVEMCIGEDKFDASSVLDIQWAGGKIKKENIQEVMFRGDSRAIADLRILAEVNYGEDSMGKGIPLPSELSYLK